MKTGWLDKHHSISVLTLAAVALGLTTGGFAPGTVRADGCFVAPPFVWDKAKDINEPTQKAILVYADGHEDLILQVKYQGPVEEFGWLVPVPDRPTVQPGSLQCFYELSRYTQEHWEPRPMSATMGMSDASPALAGGGPPPPVQVIEIKTVGAYEVAVLSASTPGSLEDWLAANQFAFPKAKAAVIDDYVRRHWYFVAIKINLAKAGGFQLASGAARRTAGIKSNVAAKLSEGELPPLQLSFASDQCVFPLKISSVNGTPSEVQVYVLSPEPLVERTMFEKKFPSLRPLALDRDAQRIQSQERSRELRRSLFQRLHPGETAISDSLPPVETNLPMDLILKRGVPEDALLPYGEISAKDFPVCSRMIPGFKGKTWWLTKQTWTFQPEEMQDLRFDPAAAVFLDDLAGEAGFYVAANLVRLGTKAVPALVEALQSTNRRVRIHAASVCDTWNGGEPALMDKRVLACLPVLLQDPEWEVRQAAAELAGWSWQPSLAEPLVRLLLDTNPGVASSATATLIRNIRGDRELLPALWKLFREGNPEVRVHALEVISEVGEPIPKADLIPLLTIPDPRIVRLVIGQLRQTEFSYEDLAPLLQNHSEVAREEFLLLFGARNDPESIGAILPLLRDPDPRLRNEAWRRLQTLSGQSIPQDQPEQWARWWAANKNTLLIAEDTQAIKQNPHDGEEYHMRGCRYYDAHEFSRALADFRQAVRWGSKVPDYTQYRIWLLRARAGETVAATHELAAYLAARKTGRPGDWPSTVGRFLIGQLTEADLLRAAANPDAQTDREQHCEAWFYAGMKQLLAGDSTTAAGDFQKCQATGVENFEEYSSAGAELKLLPPAR